MTWQILDELPIWAFPLFDIVWRCRGKHVTGKKKKKNGI
jgi:hypothetical protein